MNVGVRGAAWMARSVTAGHAASLSPAAGMPLGTIWVNQAWGQATLEHRHGDQSLLGVGHHAALSIDRLIGGCRPSSTSIAASR